MVDYKLQRFVCADNFAAPHVVAAPEVANNVVAIVVGVSLAAITTEQYIYITSFSVECTKSNGAQFLFEKISFRMSGLDAFSIPGSNATSVLVEPYYGGVLNFDNPKRVKVSAIAGYGFTVWLTGSGVVAGDSMSYVYNMGYVGENLSGNTKTIPSTMKSPGKLVLRS